MSKLVGVMRIVAVVVFVLVALGSKRPVAPTSSSAPEAGARAVANRKMQRTAPDKRKNRSKGSKWRVGTGSAKKQRTIAWSQARDPELGGFWVGIMRAKVPDVPVTRAALRKFLLDQLREQSSAPPGPPTNEIIVVERDEESITCRMVKDALERADDIVEDASSQELKKSIGLPYVAARAPTAHEWATQLYNENTGAVDVFTSSCSTWEHLASCGLLQLAVIEGRSSASKPPSAPTRSASSEPSAPIDGGFWGEEVSVQRPASNDSYTSSDESESDADVVFAFHEERQGTFDEIQKMRHQKGYMKDEGFIWATGMGKKAAGRRVQWRFKERGYWVETPALPTIAELRCYVEPRFRTLQQQQQQQQQQ